MDEDEISIQSGLTLGTLDSASVASASTIFLSEPPGIPHVDMFIKNPKCKYENIKPVRKGRKGRSKGLERAKEVDARGGAKGLKRSETRELADLKKKDFLNFFNYIDACGDFNGVVTMNELEMGFAKYRHAASHHHEEDEARSLMHELESTITSCGLTPETWYDLYHTGGKRSMDSHSGYHHHHHDPRHTHQNQKHHHSDEYNDKKHESGVAHVQHDKSKPDSVLDPEVDYKNTWMTHIDLHSGIATMRQKLFLHPWTKKEMEVVQRYMDPSADGNLSMEEVKRAFRRLHMPAESHFIMLIAGDILNVLDTFVHDRHLRVRDLFEMLINEDSSNSRELTKKDMYRGLRKLLKTEAGKQAILHEAVLHNHKPAFDTGADDDASVGSLGSMDSWESQGSAHVRSRKTKGRRFNRKRPDVVRRKVDAGDDTSVGSTRMMSSVSRKKGIRTMRGMGGVTLLPAVNASSHRQMLQKVAAEGRALSDQRYLFRSAVYSNVMSGRQTVPRIGGKPRGKRSGITLQDEASANMASGDDRRNGNPAERGSGSVRRAQRGPTSSMRLSNSNTQFAKFLNDHSSHFTARFKQIDKQLDKALARLADF